MFVFLVTMCLQAAYVSCNMSEWSQWVPHITSCNTKDMKIGICDQCRPKSDGSLDCYQCDKVQDRANCHTLVVCPSDSVCGMDSSTTAGQTHYNMSCKHTQDCPRSSLVPSTTLSSPNIIGGRKRATPDTSCSECCSRDSCNKFLCSGSSQTVTGQCVDDPTFDCVRVSTFYPVCTDVAHAKQVCRRFCGLCDLVDGAWAGWSSWSNCDVTCGNGTTVRTRSCTNPAPAHGGTNCTGISTQHSSCHLNACPVHGGWSGWSTWNNCSSTCGLGLQTKRRTCSNPRPALYGDHCFGDSLEDKPCFLRACADGGWSGWGSWGACSATCNGGIQHRTRSCDHPRPSILGRDCPGNNEESQSCHNDICPGSGSITPIVAFKARNVVDISPSTGSLIRYNTAVVNVGGGYNTSTGYFTAPYTGLYSFTVHICTYPHNEVALNIIAAGKIIGTAHNNNQDVITCSSGDGVADLKSGDQVWVKCYHADTDTNIYQDSNRWNSFSGMLIHSTT